MSLIMDRELITPGYSVGLDAAGTITGATAQAQAFTNGLIAPTLYGGAAANDDLTLEPTSHATKTTAYVLLAPSGASVGIGTLTPGATASSGFTVGQVLEIKSSTASVLNAIYLRRSDNAAGLDITSDNPTTGKVFFDSRFNTVGTGGGFQFRTKTNVTAIDAVRIAADGTFGIGTTLPDTLLHALLTDAGTDAVVNVLTVGHESSGTPAAGFGAGVHLTLESSTTAKQSAALLAASWVSATHASRTARLALSAYDSGGAREGIRIDADGSQALLSFYGVAATARQLLATGAGATVDQVITALQTLGLLKQS